MSTEAAAADLGHARHVLRVALGAPFVYALSNVLGLALPFLAPLVFVTFAVAMRRAPPAKAAVLLLAVMFGVPAALAALSTALADHTGALVAVIAVVLFLAYRMVFDPRTAALGNLVAVFTLLMPVLTSPSQLVAGLFPALLSFNGALGLVGVYVAFAIFPAPLAPTAVAAPPPAAPDAGERTRRALAAVAVMIPLIAVYLSLDLTSAVRALIVCSTVLLAADRSAQLRQGGVAIVSVLLAGGAAVLVSLWLTLWPEPLPMLLVLALVGLALAPRALRGRHAAAFGGALAALWTLIGASSDDPVGQTVYWTLLAIAGAAYAVGVHALLPSRAARPSMHPS